MSIAHSFSTTDSLYEFNFGNGKKAVLPRAFVILVNDDSGLLSVKLSGSRKTLFLSENNNANEDF